MPIFKEKQFIIKINQKTIILLSAVIIITFLAGGLFWVKAAFIEPDFAPNASDQDFAQNILGANSADNEFVSDAVTGNNDGSIIERMEYFTDYMEERDRNDYTYGRGWVASSSGDASVALTHQACEEADGWVWFEDANGDGDTIDDEDGICVATTTVSSGILTWNGMDHANWADNTYIAGYECEGSFPSGTVKAGTYSGRNSSGNLDTTWNDGDCALCQADCYDGRKDLPDQIGQDGGAYTGEAYGQTSHDGPITPEVLKNWKGTRLPTFQDFFGFCGATSGDTDATAGDSLYHGSGASSNKTLGDYGHNAGRGANGSPHDEYIDLSNTSREWLSEQHINYHARIAGDIACSNVSSGFVSLPYRFRAVFRP